MGILVTDGDPAGITAGRGCGSGSGIGQATAEKFAHEGARVAVCDINEATAKVVADGINAAGGEDVDDQYVLQ